MNDFYPSVNSETGFLSNPDPLTKLPNFNGSSHIDALAFSLPESIRTGHARIQLDRKVANITLPYSMLKEHLNRLILNRLHMIYAYLASAYIHGEETTGNVIPVSIAKPLCALSDILKRPPILSYADYALNNWRRYNAKKPIELGNIALVQKFHDCLDEDWFILVHVDIEAKAGVLLKNIYSLVEFIASNKEYVDDFFAQALEQVLAAFIKINNTLARMPEQCHPEVYYLKVRPYIFGFNKVIYEGVENCSFFASDTKEQTFRGETGAQSSIIPSVLAGFGIKHKDSILTEHLKDMRKYMPVSHHNFILHLEESKSIRDYILEKKPGAHIVDLYNKIIQQLIAFRKQHFQYAVDYIHKKCENPAGTGGTPYIKWLDALISETESYMLGS